MRANFRNAASLLIAAIILNHTAQAKVEVPYDPYYGWQFRLNDYTRKEFELSFRIKPKSYSNKDLLLIGMSCSQKVFLLGEFEKNSLKKRYGLKQSGSAITLGDLQVFCDQGHTAIKSPQLWEMLSFNSRIQALSINSEALSTPLFSPDLKYMALPILNHFSNFFKFIDSKIQLIETTANLTTCFAQNKTKVCWPVGNENKIQIDRGQPFTIGIVNSDVGVWVNYRIDFPKNTLVAWGSKDFLSNK